ncbi:MAG TPA: HPr family phosphocarrier protein [Opitutae bacterium]|nr:PTS sugar transporter subunit IIA [Puniceicoccaceae bacterium]HBR94784.1 HPr family phosphocarrier protein [Opitutae bacterium]|tara:strand:- start:455 stop:709 length:255 start_codon:yes stop_codon:yes gene_type:complete
MKQSEVTVPWEQGLHLRPATDLVHLGQQAKSSIIIKSGNKIANIKNILSILMLCASVGTTLTIEVNGEDEASQKIHKYFETSSE